MPAWCDEHMELPGRALRAHLVTKVLQTGPFPSCPATPGQTESSWGGVLGSTEGGKDEGG